MRIVTPLFPDKLDERLDRTRVTLHVSPMVREVCAKGCPRSPIRSLLIMRRRVPRCYHRFEQKVMKEGSTRGYTLGC